MPSDHTPEEVDGPVYRPFADVLRELAAGTVAEDLSIALSSLVQAVTETQKAGSLTVRIDVKPMKNVMDALAVSARITEKRPDSEPVASIFYSDDDGNLVRDHPRQTALFGRGILVAEADAHIADAR